MAKKNVSLRISNKQFSESIRPTEAAFERQLNLEDEVEIWTEATLYSSKDKPTCIMYDELNEEGSGSTRTLIRLNDGTLEVKHFGGNEDENDKIDLHLEKGVMNITRYVTPMSRMDLQIYTNELSDTTDEEGYGKISADYSIRFDKFVSTRNKLEIEIKPS